MVDRIKQELRRLGTKERAMASQRYFKTGVGQYGEGDVFIGLTMPEQRRIAKQHLGLGLPDIRKLLESKEHEFRMVALLIMTYQYATASDAKRKRLYDFYLTHTKWINNWDLVDVTAHKIVGAYLQDKDHSILLRLARSESLWERRIAIVSTFSFIAKGESKTALSIAEMLLQDTHDLIHKAVGWMLREVGKCCGESVEKGFLKLYAPSMPRTMLRYAIERFDADTRMRYMHMHKYVI
ncbi:MAG: DNA alkylation repair protein [Candidatus Moranbacteria bacterium]|nr:DNA alkylation repair protein [Candidatus Moranbacteria bacterium]